MFHCLEFNELNDIRYTLILRRRIIFILKFSINVISVIHIFSLIIFPSYSKSFSSCAKPGLLIWNGHIISIWTWFLFSISEYNYGNWFFISFTECTAFVGVNWGRELRLDNVTAIRGILLESTIFREPIFMRCMSPSRCRLSPTRTFFRNWYFWVINHCRFFRLGANEEVCCVGMITAHMMSWIHALILAKSVLAWHS